MHQMVPYKDLLSQIPINLGNEMVEVQATLNAMEIGGEEYRVNYVVKISAGVQKEFVVLSTVDYFGLEGYGKEMRRIPMLFTVQSAEYVYACLKDYIEIRNQQLKLTYTSALPVGNIKFSHDVPWGMR